MNNIAEYYQRAETAVKHESDCYTQRNWSPWIGLQKPG